LRTVPSGDESWRSGGRNLNAVPTERPPVQRIVEGVRSNRVGQEPVAKEPGTQIVRPDTIRRVMPIEAKPLDNGNARDHSGPPQRSMERGERPNGDRGDRGTRGDNGDHSASQTRSHQHESNDGDPNR
jgi:hypothetical protein